MVIMCCWLTAAVLLFAHGTLIPQIDWNPITRSQAQGARWRQLARAR